MRHSLYTYVVPRSRITNYNNSYSLPLLPFVSDWCTGRPETEGILLWPSSPSPSCSCSSCSFIFWGEQILIPGVSVTLFSPFLGPCLLTESTHCILNLLRSHSDPLWEALLFLSLLVKRGWDCQVMGNSFKSPQLPWTCHTEKQVAVSCASIVDQKA